MDAASQLDHSEALIMRIRELTAALACIVLLPSLATAQIHASEHSTLTQRVSKTTLSIEYDRPVARGRTLFGDGAVVKYGEVWTPGANWATTLEVDRDVKIDGQPLPKGKYSLWLIPQKSPATWTMMFAKTARRFHTRIPPASDEQLRVPVKPEQGMHMETLALYFPIVTPDGATLRVHWGTTFVAMQIGVEMPPLVSLPAEQRPQYVGTYHMRVTPSSGAPYEVDIEIRDEKGALTARARPRDIFGAPVELVPVAEGRFHVAYPDLGKFKGQFYTEPGMIFIFDRANGHAQTVQMLGYDNSVIGKGVLAK